MGIIACEIIVILYLYNNLFLDIKMFFCLWFLGIKVCIYVEWGRERCFEIYYLEHRKLWIQKIVLKVY